MKILLIFPPPLRGRAKVFDYDMTIMQIRKLDKNLPGLLIHDSDIFDPVDERQVAKALEYAENTTKKINTQYICTLNSDRIPEKYFSDDFKNVFYKECIRLKLDDTETGGIFGLRIK